MLFYSLFLFVGGLTEAGHLILGEVIPLDCGSDKKKKSSYIDRSFLVGPRSSASGLPLISPRC